MHFQLRERGRQSARHVQARLPDRETNTLEDRPVSVYAGLRGRLYTGSIQGLSTHISTFIWVARLSSQFPPIGLEEENQERNTQLTRYVAPVATVNKPD